MPRRGWVGAVAMMALLGGCQLVADIKDKHKVEAAGGSSAGAAGVAGGGGGQGGASAGGAGGMSLCTLPGEMSTPCSLCLDNQCCQQFIECAGDPACTACFDAPVLPDDPSTCGPAYVTLGLCLAQRCDDVCNSAGGASGAGGAGAGGAAVVAIASGQNEPYAIKALDGQVYFTNRAGRAVVRVSSQGGDPAVLYQDKISSMGEFVGLALEGEHVLWTMLNQESNDRLYRIKRDGSESTPLQVSFIELQFSAALEGGAVVASGLDVVWSDRDGAMGRAPASGGETKTLGGPLLKGPFSLATDGTSLFFMSGASLQRAPLSGGDPVEVASITGAACDNEPGCSLVVVGEDVLVGHPLDSGAGRISRVPKAGGAATLVADDAIPPGCIAADGVSVYWTSPGNGRVMKLALADAGKATPATVASEQSKPLGVAVDDQYVYWTNQTGGTVMRAPR